MLAWQKFGGGETPASSGKKGDHLVGDYYVAFDKAYKAEVKELTAAGMSEEDGQARGADHARGRSRCSASGKPRTRRCTRFGKR